MKYGKMILKKKNVQRLGKARHPHRQKCQNEKSGGLKIR